MPQISRSGKGEEEEAAGAWAELLEGGNREDADREGVWLRRGSGYGGNSPSGWPSVGNVPTAQGGGGNGREEEKEEEEEEEEEEEGHVSRECGTEIVGRWQVEAGQVVGYVTRPRADFDGGGGGGSRILKEGRMDEGGAVAASIGDADSDLRTRRIDFFALCLR